MMTTDLSLGYLGCQFPCPLKNQTAMTSLRTAQPQKPLRHSIDAILHKAPYCATSTNRSSSCKPTLPHIETLRRHDITRASVLPAPTSTLGADRSRCMAGFEEGEESRGGRSSQSSSDSCEEEEDVVVVDDTGSMEGESAEEHTPEHQDSPNITPTPGQKCESVKLMTQNSSFTTPSAFRPNIHLNVGSIKTQLNSSAEKVKSAFRPIVRPWLIENTSGPVSGSSLPKRAPGREGFRLVGNLQAKCAQSGIDAISMLRKQSSAFKVACSSSRRPEVSKQQMMMALSPPAMDTAQPLPSTLASWFSWLRSGGLHYGTHSAPQRFHPVAPPTRGILHPSNAPAPPPQAPRYNCEACGKSYSTFGGLSKHKQFHCSAQIKKDFRCKFCDKSYSSLGALKMHIRTHTLPCKCTVCGKAFSRPWLLQGHLRTHTGEKPFSCPHCARAFADRSNLRAHLQTHSDVKKYSCRHCSKTFSRMSLLVKHRESSCLALHS